MLSNFKYYVAIISVLTIFSIGFFKFDLNQQDRYLVTAYVETNISNESYLYELEDEFKETKNNETKTPKRWVGEKIDFLKKYPFLTDCKHDYNKRVVAPEYSEYHHPNTTAPKETHDIRITRALIFYFPIKGKKSYQYELRWVYRSWIHMMQFEPAKWRTDLIIFIESDSVRLGKSDFSLKDLNCRFENVRQSPQDKPMCTLFKYIPLESRTLARSKLKFNTSEEIYKYLLNDVDIFDENPDKFEIFIKFLKKEIGSYRYLNSILIGFEGYEYFKSAGYDFIIRSDMDIFVTPLFGKWIPVHCNDFNVGKAAFSTDFNERRLGRAAERIGLEYAYRRNLGSTWYSTPNQIRLVAYLTLFGMAYVAREEFTPIEREGKLGGKLWPFWHYGVLLLYGQSVALNHLIAASQIGVVKNFLMDIHSGFSYSTHTIILIHVYHSPSTFSKFKFKAGVYDNWTNVTESDEVRYYSLRMALEGKRFGCSSLHKMLQSSASNKI